MINYKIIKENIEFRTVEGPNLPKTKISDLKDFFFMRNGTDYEKVETFKNLSLAKAKFNEEKALCETKKFNDGGITIVLFDDLKLVEEEHDEDGNIQQLDIIDRHIEFFSPVII